MAGREGEGLGGLVVVDLGEFGSGHGTMVRERLELGMVIHGWKSYEMRL